MKLLETLLVQYANKELTLQEIQPLILDLFRITRGPCSTGVHLGLGHWCAQCKDRCRDYFLAEIKPPTEDNPCLHQNKRKSLYDAHRLWCPDCNGWVSEK